jgi:hypothetical protein
LSSGDTKIKIANYYYGGNDWKGEVGFYVIETRGPHAVTDSNGYGRF